MQLSPEIFCLRAPVDTLAIGPATAFGQAALRALRDGEVVRGRLRTARLDPAAMPALRRAFERWRLGDEIGLGDDALIDRVADDVRSSRLVAVLLHNPEADLRPGAEIAAIDQALNAPGRDKAAPFPSTIEGRLERVLTLAERLGRAVDTVSPWHRLTDADVLARNISVLRAWARTRARGPATMMEAFHAAKGVPVPSLALFEAAALLFDTLGQVGDARDAHGLDATAGGMLRAIRLLTVEGFVDILHLAANRGTEGINTRPARRDRDQRPRDPAPRAASKPTGDRS